MKQRKPEQKFNIVDGAVFECSAEEINALADGLYNSSNLQLRTPEDNVNIGLMVRAVRLTPAQRTVLASLKSRYRANPTAKLLLTVLGCKKFFVDVEASVEQQPSIQ